MAPPESVRKSALVGDAYKGGREGGEKRRKGGMMPRATVGKLEGAV